MFGVVGIPVTSLASRRPTPPAPHRLWAHTSAPGARISSSHRRAPAYSRCCSPRSSTARRPTGSPTRCSVLSRSRGSCRRRRTSRPSSSGPTRRCAAAGSSSERPPRGGQQHQPFVPDQSTAPPSQTPPAPAPPFFPTLQAPPTPPSGTPTTPEQPTYPTLVLPKNLSESV
jgi:hypothetical protein